MKTVILILLLYSQVLTSQNRTDSYYFSITGDTVLFPKFSVRDSTFISIATIQKNKPIEIRTFAVTGFDKYIIPESILKQYMLKLKGILVPNDSTKSEIFVQEEVIKNKEIGTSLDHTKKAFEVKINFNVFFKKKIILKNFLVIKNYDDKNKRTFRNEKLYRPNIIKVENKNIYFITLSPKEHHPDLGIKTWEILDNFTVLVK